MHAYQAHMSLFWKQKVQVGSLWAYMHISSGSNRKFCRSFLVQEERMALHWMQQKARTQALKLKVERKSVLTSLLHFLEPDVY
jgi:hypothetical protein